MTELIDPTTVRLSVDVGITPERAFELFTAEIGSWWDEDKHILQAPLKEMIFEPWVGGNIIDRGVDGSECRWSRVLAYDPPQRVCFSWDINIQWQIETDPERCSDIEITFAPRSSGGTTVTLTHRNLDRHGPGWESMRDAVAGGWSLEGFARLAGRADLDLPTVTDETMREWLSRAKAYTAVLLWRTDKVAEPGAGEHVWEHGRRNMALAEAGLLPIVLPASDGSRLAGIGVFTGSPDEVGAILAGDPGVQAGLFEYEIHPVRGMPGAVLPS